MRLERRLRHVKPAARRHELLEPFVGRYCRVEYGELQGGGRFAVGLVAGTAVNLSSGTSAGELVLVPQRGIGAGGWRYGDTSSSALTIALTDIVAIEELELERRPKRVSIRTPNSSSPPSSPE